MFEQLGGVVNGARGGVIVLHKGFDALENVVLCIAEALGDDRLLLEVELVGRAAVVQVDFGTGAQQEVVGRVHGNPFVTAQHFGLFEILE